MNWFIINIICSHSIVFPAFYILIRRRHIPSTFYPFALLLWLGLVNESISLIQILLHRGNMGNSNIYILLEYFLLLWQFHRWNTWKIVFTVGVGLSGLIAWILEHGHYYTLSTNTSIFRLAYSAVIVLLAMNQITKVITEESKKLFRNPTFIISFSLLLYYTFKTYYESFNVLHITLSEHFFYWHWIMLNFINLIANLLFAYAIIWIQKKKYYSLRH